MIKEINNDIDEILEANAQLKPITAFGGKSAKTIQRPSHATPVTTYSGKKNLGLISERHTNLWNPVLDKISSMLVAQKISEVTQAGNNMA